MGEDREILEQIATGDPLPHLASPRAEIRRLAVAASARVGLPALPALRQVLAADPDERTRAEVVEVLGGIGSDGFDPVWSARHDPSPRVVESVATALGELGDDRAVPWLVATATEHGEVIVREAAVAALGAIGNPAALGVLLEAVQAGKPQIRRRAVVALTAFDGPEVEMALTRARLDRNPMVREVAEMVLGREGSA